MPLLEAREIYKSYRSGLEPVDVLHGVGLAVEKGDFVTVFGTSGTGKSTLLHILGGLDRPSRGEVIFDSDPLYTRSESALARFRNREVGFVFQFYHLLPEFSALENVMLPCLIGGISKAKARERAREIISDVGLTHREGHRPSELSGGEQQRVAMARALVQRPRLLLADEPTGNLDETIGSQIINLISDIAARREMAVVLVTHNPNLIAGAKRRVELRGGTLHEIS